MLQRFAQNALQFVASVRVPGDEIEQGLEHFCKIAPQGTSSRTRKKDLLSFKHVASLLSNHEDPTKAQHWSLRPRIYTILRNIERLDTMRDFIASGQLDAMLPFSFEELPISLGSSRHEFLDLQVFCLTDALELEKGEQGRHIQFAYDADLHFHRMRSLGNGGFGYVDQVWSRLSHKQFARKKFRRSFSAQETIQRYRWFQQEIGALKRLSHAHLVKIKGTYSDTSCFAFLMEPVADCDLHTYLTRMRADHLANLRSFFGCLANALTYLHSAQVYHWDLKPTNILVKGGKIYLTDFGAAHDWSTRERSTTWSNTARTIAYWPPEHQAYSNGPKTYAIDMWSMGVVFLEMVTVLRCAKLRDQRAFFERTGSRSSYVHANPVATNAWLERLRKQDGPEYDNQPLIWVKDLLNRDPQRRPTARALRGIILKAHGFCNWCCLNSDQDEVNVSQTKFHEAGSVSDDSIVAFLDAHENHVVNPDDEVEGTIFAPNDTIKSSLVNTEELATAHGGPKNIMVIEDLPFDIVEDDEGTVQPETSPDEITHEPMPHRLRDVDIFGRLDPETTTHLNDTASDVFEIISDTRSDAETIPFDTYSDQSSVRSSIEDRPCARTPPNEEIRNCLQTINEHEDDDPECADRVPPVQHDHKDNEAVIDTPRSSAFLNYTHQPDIRFETTCLDTDAVYRVNGNALASAFRVGFHESVRDWVTQTNNADAYYEQPLIAHPNGPVYMEREYYDAKETSPCEAEANISEDVGTRERFLGHGQGLTVDNLRQHLRDTAGQKQTRRPKGRKMYKEWVQKILVKESEVATTVMSEATKREFAKGGSLLRWQAKHTPILEKYVIAGKVNAVRYLLQIGLDPNDAVGGGLPPLYKAVKGRSLRHNKCAEALLRSNANVNLRTRRTGRTMLSVAIENPKSPAYRGLIWTLLHYGANPNIKDRAGDYPLLSILYGGYEPLEQHKREALALILEASQYPVDVNVEPPGTLNLPIHLAARRHDPYVVHLLLERKASLHSKNGAGQTPFQIAIEDWSTKISDDQREVARLLLEAGADVNSQLPSSGATGLIKATMAGDIDLIDLLRSFNADPELKDNNGLDTKAWMRRLFEESKLSKEKVKQIRELCKASGRSGSVKRADAEVA